MSVVVWDGKTLAADRMAVTGEVRFLQSKMRVYPDLVVAWTGQSCRGEAMAHWARNGANVEDFPKFQEDDDNWCRLIVVDRNGCRVYEATPFPMEVEAPFMAWGSGRDFAIGALSMGADAVRAVEVASEHCVTCGMGVDYVVVGDGELLRQTR